MEQEALKEMYEYCMKMDLGLFLDIIDKTTNKEERAFITSIYNFRLQENQKECIRNGVF